MTAVPAEITRPPDTMASIAPTSAIMVTPRTGIPFIPLTNASKYP